MCKIDLPFCKQTIVLMSLIGSHWPVYGERESEQTGTDNSYQLRYIAYIVYSTSCNVVTVMITILAKRNNFSKLMVITVIIIITITKAFLCLVLLSCCSTLTFMRLMVIAVMIPSFYCHRERPCSTSNCKLFRNKVLFSVFTLHSFLLRLSSALPFFHSFLFFSHSPSPSLPACIIITNNIAK